MTMPILVGKYQKEVTLTRLKKFYTSINQAIKLSENDNGEFVYWEYPAENDSESMKVFYNKYLKNYLKTVSNAGFSKNNVDNDGNTTDEIYNNFVVYFADGSAMILRQASGIDISFYPYASKVNNVTNPTRDSFGFVFNKSNSVGPKSFVEPYSAVWDGTRENLINHPRYGCRTNSPTNMYCCKLIQIDNWQIKDDYPW